ncbi:hypothetical protein [Flavobacterium sp. JP2137]|uniref:hypothetical protein n=1 Tax=Flavobacterium sp. JP2137 TaxID=3414510 RepID=UPI003D2FF231
MKTKLEINELQGIPLVVQEKLLHEINNGNVELIFATSPHFSTINQITVILNKDIPEAKRQELQESSWTKEVFKQFGVVVTFCIHIVFPFKSDYHLTYLSLYLNPQFIIYSRKDNSWGSLLQNFYTFSIRRQLSQLDNWVLEIKQKHEDYKVRFIASLVQEKQFQAVFIMYVHIIRFYLHSVQSMLFPKNTIIFNSDVELLESIEENYPELSQIFINNDIDKMYLCNLLDADCKTEITFEENDFAKVENICTVIQGQFEIAVNNFFIPRIEYLLSDLKGKQIFCKVEYEQFMLDAVIKRLLQSYDIDLVYLIESKVSNDSMEFLLFIVGSDIKIQMEQHISTLIRNHFNQRVEITCLLHKTTWIERHGTKFLPFIYERITDANVIYSRTPKKHSKFILPVFELPEDTDSSYWQKDFWKLCQDNLESQWLQMDLFSFSIYQIGHVAQLGSIFKQLCLTFLYKKLNYVPHFASPRYLWKLVQWADRDYSNELMSIEQSDAFFSFLNTKLPYFPRQSTSANNPSQEQYLNTLRICKDFYNRIKELYTN